MTEHTQRIPIIALDSIGSRTYSYASAEFTSTSTLCTANYVGSTVVSSFLIHVSNADLYTVIETRIRPVCLIVTSAAVICPCVSSAKWRQKLGVASPGVYPRQPFVLLRSKQHSMIICP